MDEDFKKILDEIKEHDGFYPSEEQQKFLYFVMKGVGNGIVNACAGSGKTRTIKNALRFIKEGKKVLLLAHNLSVRDKLEKEAYSIIPEDKQKNFVISTYHGLGQRFLREAFNKKFNLNEDKYIKYLNTHLTELSGGRYAFFNKVEQISFKSRVTRLCLLARQEKCQCIKEIKKVNKHYGVCENELGEFDAVLKLMRWGKEYLEEIDYLDMLWLPYELCINVKHSKFDYIFIDEAQDSSPLQQELALKCTSRGGRVFAVGDRNQSINAWCGADADAFNTFETKLAPITSFSLTTSFRCAKKIVEFSNENTIVKNMTHKENAPEGKVVYNAKLSDVREGDMIICRNSLPLIDAQNKLMNMGLKVVIKGNNVIGTIRNIINETESDSINDVINTTRKLLLSNFNSYRKKIGGDDRDATMGESVTNYYEAYRSLVILAKTKHTKSELLEFINSIIPEDSYDKYGNEKVDVDDKHSSYVSMYTIHKSKGLECDRVFIIGKENIHSYMSKSKWQQEADNNLEYVAYTRPKLELLFVDDSEVETTTIFSNPYSMLKDIERIENAIIDEN